MRFFGTVMNTMFRHGQAAALAPATAAAPTAATPAPIATPAAAPVAAEPVNVEALPTQMVAQKESLRIGKARSSACSRSLGMISVRKELANKLNIRGDDDGTAEENNTLHKTVLAKLAENGGKVPADLRG